MTDDISLILDDGMNGMSSDAHVGLGDVDVDDVDLFGGPVELGLSSHPPPPSKQLQLRVDEQRIRGCCQRIGWSKQGTIATIGEDGQSIELRYLRIDPETTTWGLSEPTIHAQFSNQNIPTTFSGGPIMHLAWAATGHPELAVIDSVGRISILAFSMSLNRPYTLRSWEADPIDDLNAVVGCYWLPIMPPNKQYNFIHGPAVREDNGQGKSQGLGPGPGPASGPASGHGYRYETTFIHAFGPYHPNPVKSALLCITASGKLRLFYSQNSSVVHDTSIELENIATSDDLATHASICSDKGMLLIAMTTASRQLKIVRAAIHWNLPQQQQQQQDKSIPILPQNGIQFSPTMQQKPSAVTTWLQRGADESQLDISSAQISHVEMLPSALPGPNQAWSPPLVVTVRTYIPTPSTVHYNPEPRSIINRWELLTESTPQPLHPAFEQLGFKPTQSNNAQGQTRLNRLPPIILDKTVISVQTLQHGRALCFFFSDGTLQYRDRITFEEIYNEPNPARISALQQAGGGFQFVNPTSCLAAALSPTNCSFAQLGEGGNVKWNNLKYVGPEFTPATGNEVDANYTSVMAGLTTAVSTASLNQICYDDILAVAREFVDRPRFSYDWVLEIVRILKINVDYSEEAHHDQLVRNNSLHMCLSILNHLGFQGEYKKRSFCSKFAMLALNMRNIVILITIASNTPGNLKEKNNPLDDPDVVDALAGCAKWAIDLLAYTSDCLFNLLDDPKFMSFLRGAGPNNTFNEMVAYLQDKNEIALHLIMCSSTRGFLSAICRRLLHVDSISARATQFYELQQQQNPQNQQPHPGSSSRPPLILAYQKMQQYTSSSLIKVQEFDKLLWTLGGDIRLAYQSQMPPGTQGNNNGKKPSGQPQTAAEAAAKRMQAHCELTLLLANSPPPTFRSLLYKFFTENVRAFRALTDPAKLYFADYSVLEVEDDTRSLQEKRARHSHIDVFKRVELGRGSGPGNKVAVANGNGAGDQANGNARAGTTNRPAWRRCVRCAAIMEDVSVIRPGYTFVLAQQRKCSCSGNWGMLPAGGVVG